MTIEIHTPELEALIQERMNSGLFQNVEEVLIQALKSTNSTVVAAHAMTGRTGADLVRAMMASPYKEIDLEMPSVRMPIRDITL